MGSDGVVHQKFRLWHMEDAPVQITGATMAKMSVPAVSGGMPPSPNPVALDFAEILQHRNIDPGATIEETLEYDFGSDPDVYAVVYEVHGVTPEGVQARGQLTVMRPPPRPTRDNSIPVEDPAMILKIRRAMEILKQETVSQEDIWRLEREGRLR